MYRYTYLMTDLHGNRYNPIDPSNFVLGGVNAAAKWYINAKMRKIIFFHVIDVHRQEIKYTIDLRGSIRNMRRRKDTVLLPIDLEF